MEKNSEHTLYRSMTKYEYESYIRCLENNARLPLLHPTPLPIILNEDKNARPKKGEIKP